MYTDGDSPMGDQWSVIISYWRLKYKTHIPCTSWNNFQLKINKINVVIATKGLQDRSTNITAGTTVKNKGKLILKINSTREPGIDLEPHSN